MHTTEPSQPLAPPITFRVLAAAVSVMFAHVSDATRKRYRSLMLALAALYGETPVERVQVHELLEWAGGRRHTLAQVKAVLAAARMEGLIAGHPLLETRLRVGRKPVFVPSEAQLQRLLASAAAALGQLAGVYIDLITLITAVGATGTEAAAVWGCDVDLPGRRLLLSPRVRPQGRPSSETARWVALPRELEPLLRRRVDAAGPGPLFVDKSGRPADNRRLAAWHRQVRDAAELPAELSLHSLRHLAATRMIEAGAPIDLVYRQLGRQVEPRLPVSWAGWHEALLRHLDARASCEQRSCEHRARQANRRRSRKRRRR
jgi:integrase